MAEIKVGDKVRVAERAGTLEGHWVDPDFFGKEGVVDGFHDEGDVSVYLEDLGYSQYIAPFYLTRIEEISEASFKVGDYLTEEAGDIVWKVIEVGEGGSLLTEALLIQVEDDGADVIRLAPEETSVRTMKKATPEQIEAFENHPYWDKQESVADAISPEEDAVNHPSHYTSDPSGVECIQITRHRNFNVGNAIKYLWRAGLKKSEGRSEHEKQIEDLKKAVFYIQDEIKRLES